MGESGEKRLPDGRRFYSWAEAGEMPDRDLPCPACGKAWGDHAGEVEFAALDGHAGYALPPCPPSERDSPGGGFGPSRVLSREPPRGRGARGGSSPCYAVIPAIRLLMRRATYVH
jgi:hypothetical protein